MLEGFRDRLAEGLFAIANRMTAEPRHPGAGRVSSAVRTLAGVAITPDTAVTIATVWACLRYLSQSVAVLPWHAMRDDNRGPQVARTHPVDYLLWKRPSREWSSFQFRETLTHWALRWGNGYAEIEPDQLNRPFALWPTHPDRVQCCRATEGELDSYGDRIEAGELYYEVSNGVGTTVALKAERMFHVRGFGEGPVGVNVISYASQSLGWVRAAQLFGAAFFGNGLNPAGVVINKKPLKPEGLKRQRAEFEQLFKGPNNSHRTAFLDNDAEWKAIGFSARDSQLIDVHQHLVEEVCRWFGVPPHKVMHLLRATFSNIEHQAIEVVVDSVHPWVKRFEDEADFKLFGAQNRQGFYTKMNMRGLLRGDFKSQNEGLQIARNAGVVNADEWREYLDMPKQDGEGGEKYVIQSQYTTLERIGEEPVAQSPAPAPAQSEDDPPADPAAANSADEILAASELEQLAGVLERCPA